MPTGEVCGWGRGPARQSGGSPQGPRRWKILVVDDEETVRRVARECIALALGEGYEVIEASGGEEAVEAARRERPDLVLLDIMMPEVDGFEVCRRLKGSPTTRHIPIMFLTARGEEEAVEEGLALGGEGYVIKPFNAVSLAAQVSELLACRDDTGMR